VSRLRLFWTLALLPGCLGVESNPLQPLPRGGHHLLFIGNSLTYVNDLPATLAQLAASVGDTIHTGMVALPNYAVIDHANGGSNAIAAIKLGDWEYVILQQGPTSQQIYRDTLVLAAQILNPHVQAAGGRTALFMSWPSASQPSLWDAVRTSFQVAAQAVGGLFVPAGEAWRAALEENPGLALYGPDGYHPAPLGTYLAALVLYEQVTRHDPRGLPGQAVVEGQALSVSEPTVRMLQRVAHETVARFAAASSPRQDR
jgi:hypothetical protein